MRLFVPGRICLFGEHSDWAGGYRRINAEVERGYTLISGTEQGIYADVEAHPTALVLTATTRDGQRHGPQQVPMEPAALLREAQSGGFWSYIAGVAYQMLTNYHVRGLVIDNDKVLQRRHLCPHCPRLQPRLRPQADRARRDGDGLSG